MAPMPCGGLVPQIRWLRYCGCLRKLPSFFLLGVLESKEIEEGIVQGYSNGPQSCEETSADKILCIEFSP